MGSFYSTCSISGMTLTKQKTSILLLAPGFYTDTFEGRGMIVSNRMAQYHWVPFGFPMRGEYDDYGYIINFEENEFTKMLEQFFNLDINTILQNVGDDRWYEIGEKKNDKYWKRTTLDGGPIRNQKVLLDMGMTYFRTEVLEHLESGWEALSDDSRMQKLLEKISSMNPLKEMSDEELAAKLKDPSADNFIDIFHEHYRREQMNKGERTSSHWQFECYIESLARYNFFDCLPINPETQKGEILRQYRMLMSMGALRRFLVPSNYGSQDDNWTELYELNAVVQNLMLTEIKNEVREVMEAEGFQTFDQALEGGWTWLHDKIKFLKKNGFQTL